MWLLGRLAPDFKTIADFRKDNGSAFRATCRAFVQFCRQVGLISGQFLLRQCGLGDGQQFDRSAFDYDTQSDSYRCPAGKTLALKQLNRASWIYAAVAGECAVCPLKSQCTQAKQRYLTRHAHEDAFERMEQRLKAHPEMLLRRRSIVEHPFGNLKQWLFGNGRFLMRQLSGTRAEMALAVQAYNLKRAINVLGARRMIELLA